VRIGLMLRHFEQHFGGVRVYTTELVTALLKLKTPHEFVLFYKNRSQASSFSHCNNVTEVLLPYRPRLWWDQITLPYVARSYGLDVLFNPKYSIPLSLDCPATWVCHGLDWFVMPWASRWIDRINHRFMVPRYAAKADAIIAVSETTRRHVIDFLKVPAEKVHTIYSGVDEVFRKPVDAGTSGAVRARYNLPERFFLYVGALYPPKNFTRLIQAYAKIGPAREIHLVVAGGENRFLSGHEVMLPEKLGLQRWVHKLGWIEHRELPPLYALAEALLLPSLFEACPLPLLEAMAVGCPIVTADRHGMLELAGDAAVLVNPESVDDIATGIARLADDRMLRSTLIKKGIERAGDMSWERCAIQTLQVLEATAQRR
jgi:glycosyltransferase involved in cell wall biosynthesis